MQYKFKIQKFPKRTQTEVELWTNDPTVNLIVDHYIQYLLIKFIEQVVSKFVIRFKRNLQVNHRQEVFFMFNRIFRV